MNGGNGGGMFGRQQSVQREDIKENALTLPWQQYLKLVQLNAIAVTAIFAICLLVGPAAKAIALGLLLSGGSLWFWFGKHRNDNAPLTVLGALLFLTADLALFLYCPLLLVVEFSPAWWARLYGILLLCGFLWPMAPLVIRYITEIIDSKMPPVRTALDASLGIHAPTWLRKILGYPDWQALAAAEVEPEIIHTHEEIIRPLDVNANAQTHLVRGAKTRAGHLVRLDDVFEMLNAQPDAGFARSEWVGKEARDWKRKQFEDVRTLLEERDLIYPHTAGAEAHLLTWEAREEGETETDYWRTMVQITKQHARERLR